MGHQLVRSLVSSHRSLICLVRSARSLAHSFSSELVGQLFSFQGILNHSGHQAGFPPNPSRNSSTIRPVFCNLLITFLCFLTFSKFPFQMKFPENAEEIIPLSLKMTMTLTFHSLYTSFTFNTFYRVKFLLSEFYQIAPRGKWMHMITVTLVMEMPRTKQQCEKHFPAPDI